MTTLPPSPVVLTFHRPEIRNPGIAGVAYFQVAYRLGVARASPIHTTVSALSRFCMPNPLIWSIQDRSNRGIGAGKEARTPDLNLGKVALYQLSYSRAA